MKRDLKQKQARYLFCEYWPNTTFWKDFKADSIEDALNKFFYHKNHIYISWRYPDEYQYVGITPEGYTHYKARFQTKDAFERSTWRELDIIFKLLWQNEYYDEKRS